MSYRAATSEYEFILNAIIGIEEASQTEKFSETTPDLVTAILGEAGRLSDNVMAPLQRGSDLEGARLENGVVRTSPGFAEGWQAISDGGWVGMSADPEYGGMGLPFSVATAVNEMMAGACLSLQLAPLMSQGQIEALEAHASDAIKDLYLPKLISGEWTGTMNLTEPQAGSDVGALTSKAEPNGDGTYAVTGQKIFISWGDNDFTENVVHLVLARLPDGVPGTKGISLFVVPKFIPNENGKPGRANDLKVVSLEHKMGLHGSPTCVMQYDGATGWLVGQEHGGMAAMFTMMNNARLGVGGQGVGTAEGAYQHALEYALERKQGRTPSGTIADHADVRRMLMEMKADIFASRAIMLANAHAIDMSHATDAGDWTSRAAFLTPITKVFGTEVGMRVAETGVQVYGGMGFIEESGAAQYSRDVRVTAIYEGTNGIQSMDLVGRKMMDGGEMAGRLLDEIEDLAETGRGANPKMTDALWNACEALRDATDWMVAHDMQDRFSGSLHYLRAFARILGGYYHLKAAQADPGGPREKLARFYMSRMLPEYTAHLAAATAGSDGVFALSLEDLAG
ncbi:acyl-CoA dehydrogenase [Epibacterium sp. SM1979]|uniref:3-methylmercaptopropionyl-CoA dehydrogenase n=1 Tax=Tritonibacter litoralis TaxID=2662264 RepID=A0A843YHN0_9RHOB|nr:acyl-CoA dehydrogenase [Tritonibacter litoralis]MQQ08743.1 acyl-CoA dehydrogenase [Tritonibacter litoralis]